MKTKTWKKYHKWFGLIFCLFLLNFCISGIILNHRQFFSSFDVNRSLLPEKFHYHNWEKGLLQGTKSFIDTKGNHKLILYGVNGMFITNYPDSSSSFQINSPFLDFNNGITKGVENHVVKGVCQMPNKELFAVTQFRLIKYNAPQNKWIEKEIKLNEEERFTDLINKGDSLIALSRSNIYLSLPPYDSYKKIELKPSDDYKGKVSFFKTIWLLHSGQIFGLIGKLFMDFIAVILIVLCITGILYWFLPKTIKRTKKTGRKAKKQSLLLKNSLKLHKKIGTITIFFTLFLTFTGWALRPPLLIILGSTKIPAIPGTTMATKNQWHDKLRMIRYDKINQDWLLSTSKGMYSIKSLTEQPKLIPDAPKVSVMGITVFNQNPQKQWIIGSFSGLNIWDRKKNIIYDYFTHAVVKKNNKHSSSFSLNKHSIAGFSTDLNPKKEVVIDYEKGSNFAPMPSIIKNQPMSLFKAMLEFHTGRIFTFLGRGSFFYITIMGIAIMWTLFSGYIIVKNRKKSSSSKLKKK